MFAASVRATVKLASGRVIVLLAVGQVKVRSCGIIGIKVALSGSVHVLVAVMALLKNPVNVFATFRNHILPSLNVLIPVMVSFESR